MILIPNKLSKGFLVAIEGIDGAGKTTQAVLLEESLKKEGYPVLRLKEPGNSIYGDKIREIALKGRENISPQEEFELFLKDRMEDVKKNIRPALDAGKIVIMDRYYFSNIAYQGALGLDPFEIQRKNEEIAPRPDLTIILDITPGEAVRRIKNRNEPPNEFEREKYLAEVRAIFNLLGHLKQDKKQEKRSFKPSKNEAHRQAESPDTKYQPFRSRSYTPAASALRASAVRIVDGSRPVEEVRTEILNEVKKAIAES